MSPRYLSIAQRLSSSIQEGVLRPGERLPSLRNLCRNEGISLMTALSVYRRLEMLGQAEALPRSGFRVAAAARPGLRRRALAENRLVAHSTERDAILNQVLAAVGDPSMEPLGLGCPTPDRFPLEALRRLTGRLLSEQPDLWTRYSPPPGDPDLRRQIALRLQARGLSVDPGEVLITCGASEGLSLALRVLLRPGDVVAMPCPSFFGVLDAARTAGARILEFPEGPGGPDLDRFREACGHHDVKALVLVPSFSNPAGLLMPPGDRSAWAEVLRARGVALVEDDLYGDLGFDGRRPEPLAAHARPGGPPWMVVGAFSKTLLPGARVGYVAAPAPYAERLAELKRASTLSNVLLAERLAARALESGLYDRTLRRLVPAFQQGVEALREGVSRHFPEGTRMSTPRGGFLLWVELPEGHDGLRLFHAAREAGIGIIPGCVFSLGPGLERFIRLNGGATLRRPDVLETLGRLAGTETRL
jgi:DNA-binding transcriptional MocR family regulator